MKNPLLWILFISLTWSSSHAQKINNIAFYLHSAETNSPLLADLKNQSTNSTFELERLKALYKRSQVEITGNFLFIPIVSKDNGKTSFIWNGQTANDYYGYDLSQNTGSLSGQLTWTKPLLNPSFKASQQRVTATQSTVQNNIQLEKHDLEKLITDQYILCLLDQSQINFTDSMSKVLKIQLNISKKIAAQNLIHQSDLHLLKIEMLSNQELNSTCTQSYYSDLLDLNILCGIRDTNQVKLATLALEPQLKLNSATSQYLEKFRLDSLNASLQQLEFETKYKPQLNLFANTGFMTSYIKDLPQRFGASAGVVFSWSLFDGNQRHITEKQTALTINTAMEYKTAFITQNEVRKQKYLSEIANYQQRRTLLKKQMDEYDQLIDNYGKQINNGEISMIDYLTVLKNRIELNNKLLLLETNRLLLINNYNYWNW